MRTGTSCASSSPRRTAAPAGSAATDRSALERINNRSDRHFGFEQHFIRGLVKMTTRVGLALAVMMAMALGHIQPGRPRQMRSLLQPMPVTGETSTVSSKRNWIGARRPRVAFARHLVLTGIILIDRPHRPC